MIGFSPIFFQFPGCFSFSILLQHSSPVSFPLFAFTIFRAPGVSWRVCLVVSLCPARSYCFVHEAAIERKDAEIESGQKQLTGKLADSSQFKTLKKLLNQKTQQVKELRTKLEKYGLHADDRAHG